MIYWILDFFNAQGGTQRMHIRGGGSVKYYWVRISLNVIFLDPNKTETMFMTFFDIKYRC